MKEEDFEEYGVALQEIIRRLLGNTAGLPNSSVLDIKKVFSLQPICGKIIKLLIVIFNMFRHLAERPSQL